jgi:hypothetical protein
MQKYFFYFNRLSILFVLVLSTGCSSIYYKSRGKISVTMDYKGQNQKEVVLNGRKKFYLWGLIPDQHFVYLDEIGDKAGFNSLSSVTIHEPKKFKDMFIALITFGLYIPKEYSILAFTEDD